MTAPSERAPSPRSEATMTEQMTPNEKRLKALADDHFRNARDLSQRVATLQATVERQAAEIARLRGVLEAIEAGTIPRPVETPWFPDGRPSKHDRCKHDAWMYQACEGCTDAFIRQALGDHNG